MPIPGEARWIASNIEVEALRRRKILERSNKLRGDFLSSKQQIPHVVRSDRQRQERYNL
jgi:hypothetical protein